MPQTRKRTREQTEAAANGVTLPAPLTVLSKADARSHSEREGHANANGDTAVDGDEDSEGDHDEEEDEEENEVVLSEQFDGAVDSSGRPHGSGSLTIEFQRGRRRGRNAFTGNFSHGVKSAHPRQ